MVVATCGDKGPVPLADQTQVEANVTLTLLRVGRVEQLDACEALILDAAEVAVHVRCLGRRALVVAVVDASRKAQLAGAAVEQHAGVRGYGQHAPLMDLVDDVLLASGLLAVLVQHLAIGLVDGTDSQSVRRRLVAGLGLPLGPDLGARNGDELGVAKRGHSLGIPGKAPWAAAVLEHLGERQRQWGARFHLLVDVVVVVGDYHELPAGHAHDRRELGRRKDAIGVRAMQVYDPRVPLGGGAGQWCDEQQGNE